MWYYVHVFDFVGEICAWPWGSAFTVLVKVVSTVGNWGPLMSDEEASLCGSSNHLDISKCFCPFYITVIGGLRVKMALMRRVEGPRLRM